MQRVAKHWGAEAVDQAQLVAVVRAALPLWRLPQQSAVELLHISENATFRIRHQHKHTDTQSILRLHRPGYHSKPRIQSELAWLAVLGREAVLPVPRVVPSEAGDAIQTIGDYYGVMFDFISGSQPPISQPSPALFHKLGVLAARLHQHSQTWQPPADFTRPHWDGEGIFGARRKVGHWGDWRDAPNLSQANRRLLEKVETKLRARLAAYGKRGDNWGLIHADMRLANLLVENGDVDSMRVIDFDDCGFGWFMYDFAASVSFMEDSPAMPTLKQAWLGGYQSMLRLGKNDIAMLDSFILLRRMLLLAWLGGHPRADISPSRAEDFASITAQLGQHYLQD